MSTIDSIASSIYSSSSSNVQTLSESTIKKLEALGIDVSTISSESEAKRVIAEEEAKRSADNSNSEENKSSEESLYEQVKSLANKVGVHVSENDDMEEIINEISDRIDSMSQNSYNPNINMLKAELEILQSQINNSGQASMLSAMDLLSQTNKASLYI